MPSPYSQIMRWINTVRYLRPIQIYGRVWRKVYRPRPRAIPALPLRAKSVPWQATQKPISMLGPRRFRFLNHEAEIVERQCWNNPDLQELWRYNLHYFDDLVADRSAERADWHRTLIARWVAENPPGQGVGWAPYPTSLRIVNWVKWALLGNDLGEVALTNLATQADWLSRRIEYHLLGNHLLENAKALIFVGSFFEGPLATRWLTRGLNILRREIAEQILADGGHFERSPMYHAIVTEGLLDLVQLSQCYPSALSQEAASWQEKTMMMLGWLEDMCHPDGEIAFFNDSAFSIAPAPKALVEQASALGITRSPVCQVSPETGYLLADAGRARIFCDVGPVGPDYLPGHAHADSLSFELSLQGKRVFVNGGTSVYGADPIRRQTERSTRSHNTLEVDGQNSSDVWAIFRTARRARIHEVVHEIDGATTRIAASHDGYHQTGGPIHRRTWTLHPGGLDIDDHLEGPWTSARARFRLHPDLEFADGVITTTPPIKVVSSGGTLSVETGHWAPEFGRRVPCSVLVLDLTQPRSTLSLNWPE